MDNDVAVIGGTGRTGRIIVQRLLERGEGVRVLARGVGSAMPIQTVDPRAWERVRRHRVDVRDPGTLHTALADCSAVVYCVEPGTDDVGPDRPEATMFEGVANTLEAATLGAARPHVVLVSQFQSSHPHHPLNAYGRLLHWRLAGEDEVRLSGLPYTVIRPGWLTDGRPAGTGVRLEQGDRSTGTVARTDLAEACVEALYCPSANGVTLELFNRPGPAVTDWEEAFSLLQWDRQPVA